MLAEISKMKRGELSTQLTLPADYLVSYSEATLRTIERIVSIAKGLLVICPGEEALFSSFSLQLVPLRERFTSLQKRVVPEIEAGLLPLEVELQEIASDVYRLYQVIIADPSMHHVQKEALLREIAAIEKGLVSKDAPYFSELEKKFSPPVSLMPLGIFSSFKIDTLYPELQAGLDRYYSGIVVRVFKGVFCQYGFDEEKRGRYEEALQCYLQAFSCGCIESLARAGFLYLKYMRGKGAVEKGIGYLEISAKLGCIVYAEMAHLFSSGTYLKRDIERAKEYYQKAILQGDDEAKFSLAHLLYGDGIAKDEDLKQAFQLFSELAKIKHSGAFNMLGIMYEKGLGVPKDLRLALSNYHQAAYLGSAEAFSNIGQYFLDLDKRKKANRYFRKALEIYQKKADEGSSHALYLIGQMYEFGEGCEVDEKRAFDLYTQAAEKQYPPALKKLGIMYLIGDFVDRDYQKAESYLQRALRLGSVEASYYLGLLNLELAGQSKHSSKKAITYLRDAAANGHPDAIKKLRGLNKLP